MMYNKAFSYCTDTDSDIQAKSCCKASFMKMFSGKTDAVLDSGGHFM